MLKRINDEWNLLYGIMKDKNHTHIPQNQTHLKTGELEIAELINANRSGCLQNVTFIVPESLSFPTPKFDSFNMWNAFSNENCDGAILYRASGEKFDLAFVELKSGYDSDNIWKAGKQIKVSVQKMFLLLGCIPSWEELEINKIYGIIAALRPCSQQLVNIKALSSLPKEDWGNKSLWINLAYKGNCYSSFEDIDNIKIPNLPKEIEIRFLPCDKCTGLRCNLPYNGAGCMY